MAFDGIICAAGYNSFHEVMSQPKIPVLLVPSVHRRLDAQASRADFAARHGWAEVYPHEDAERQFACLHRFLTQLIAKRRLHRPKLVANGAAEMSEAIIGLVNEV